MPLLSPQISVFPRLDGGLWESSSLCELALSVVSASFVWMPGWYKDLTETSLQRDPLSWRGTVHTSVVDDVSGQTAVQREEERSGLNA